MIDWLACILVRTLGAVLCRLPPSVAVWCGETFGSLACWVQPKRARIGLMNLRAAFDGTLTPSRARRIIRGCYRQLGAGLLELLRLPVMDIAYVERYVSTDGYHHFEDAITSGRPVIVVTGHYGNWELCSITAALKGRPVVALARAQERLPKLYRLLVSYRESKGCTIAHKGSALKQVIKALAERRPVGIVADQASRQGIAVDFFGRSAFFATGPFELAYTKHALIVPAFIRRIRGPFHRLTVEPPIELPRDVPKEAAVRAGIEQFAALLTRHIRSAPEQWLWMHKRWKHTPARRALVLSDGKLGHVKQSLAAVELLRERCPELSHRVVEVRYRHRLARGVALCWSWWMPNGWGAMTCLRLSLTRESAAALLGQYADLVISCGAAAAPANLLWAAESRAKSVILMNPAPLPLDRFHLVIAPRHDRLPPRRNTIQIAGALSRTSEETLFRASTALQAHPRFRLQLNTSRPHPVIAVFLGGDTLHYVLPAAFADSLIAGVLDACEAIDGWCLVTTSRRTSPAVERLLVERLDGHPRCRLLLLASRDPLDGTMEGMLGSADVSVVTGESISMVSEACASGRRVIVIEPLLRPSTRPAFGGARSGQSRAGVEGRRPAMTRHQRFLQDLVREGHIQLVPLSGVRQVVERALKARQPFKPLDNLSPVRDALARLL